MEDFHRVGDEMSETTARSDLSSTGEDALTVVNKYKRKLEKMTREKEML